MKRLFFGLAVNAPWPQTFPEARLLPDSSRHITLSFLGDTDEKELLEKLRFFPKIPFLVGSSGYFDKMLFLPEEKPRAAAWHAVSYTSKIDHIYKILGGEKPWLSHVTLGRQPFVQEEWQKAFTPLPFITGDLHLYESLPNMTYNPIWSYSFLPPFEEIEHTGDMAFCIRGDSLDELYEHALTALAFHHTPLIHLYEKLSFSSLEEIIIKLNEAISCSRPPGRLSFQSCLLSWKRGPKSLFRMGDDC